MRDKIANAVKFERGVGVEFHQESAVNSPPTSISLFVFIAITNAAIDLSPVLLGILFTLLLLCFVIFVKVYCYRSTASTAGELNGDTKHIGNINYQHDAVKVRIL